MNRITSTVAAAALAAAAVAAGASPAHATTPTDRVIRSTDLIGALSDTRSAGHKEFLAEGISVWTDDATSQAKVAEYFRSANSLMPTSGRMDWRGTDPQPGMQIVFDASGAAGDDFNILVGEPVYGVDGSGNYTDWWLSNGSSALAKAHCPQTTGGSGSACHGTLAEWAAALPDDAVYAYGFSLGSGVKGSGVLRSMTFGSTSYGFSSVAPVVADPIENVTGTASIVKKAAKRAVKATFTSAPNPAGYTEGSPLHWSVKVDGRTVLSFEQRSGAVNRWSTRFAKRTGKHLVEVFRGTELVGKAVVRTTR